MPYQRVADVLLHSPLITELTLTENAMQFVNFSEQSIEPFNKEFENEIIEGLPVQKVWSHFVGNDGAFKSGIWDSTAGVFAGPMNDQIEFCHILEGEACIVTPDGKSRTVRAGDAFVMDNGLQPVWHVESYVRKYYVICSAPPTV